MKYRGVELKVGNEFESEICIGIEYDNTKLTQDKVIKMIRKQIANLNKRDGKCVVEEFNIEPVLDDYILVRNYKFFSLDNSVENVLHNLKWVYTSMNELNNVKVVIDVHTDDWFEIDDKEYNTDFVNWEDFEKNIQY